MALLRIEHINYYYDMQKTILKDVTREFAHGKMYAIIGHSGSGKTTLLSLLGGLDVPKRGRIFFEGRDINEIGLYKYRRDCISFIFQNYNLIEYMTPAENVSLTSKEAPLPYLEQVGLTSSEAKRNVLKLSGGEQQRVAIARALASPSKVILADEPTGNLDESTAKEIIQLLIDNAKKYNKCVIVVSHSKEVADAADEVLMLKDGNLMSERDEVNEQTKEFSEAVSDMFGKTKKKEDLTSILENASPEQLELINSLLKKAMDKDQQ